MNTELVTAADHDAGFKEIEVLRRSGKREALKLTAPNHRQAQNLALVLQKSKDATCITEACLQADCKPADIFLSRLTPESAAMVETICFALTFGSEFQKKMSELGEKLLEETGWTHSEQNLQSSQPESHTAKPGDFRCQNCGFIFGSRASAESNKTSETQSSAPLLG